MGQWSGISDFFAMGGYAQYVWGAYGFSPPPQLIVRP